MFGSGNPIVSPIQLPLKSSAAKSSTFNAFPSVPPHEIILGFSNPFLTKSAKLKDSVSLYISKLSPGLKNPDENERYQLGLYLIL